MRKIDQEIIDEAIALYLGGKTLEECVRLSGVSKTTLCRNLREQKIPQRKQVRFLDKICFCCGDSYMPTGGRQIVCEKSECQAWRSANSDIPPRMLSDYAPHGTLRKYTTGCKCEPCRDANNDHKRIDRHQMYPQDYIALLATQGGSCALCHGPQISTSRAYDVDHNHACAEHNPQRGAADRIRQSCPRCWRGLLCRTCNQQLERKVGHAYIREIEGCPSEEDAAILEYIRNPPANRLRN